jgi:hypothetical protein
MLARCGISLQRTRSWNQSPDPDYEAKVARVLAPYLERPKHRVVSEARVVISFDEKRPESLQPKHGRGWARRGRPERHRATYIQRHGIPYVVGVLEVHSDHLRARLRLRREGNATPTAYFLDWDADGFTMAEHIPYRNSPEVRPERKTWPSSARAELGGDRRLHQPSRLSDERVSGPAF